ncbi:unnamed protein product [Lasius platythorax]|uniref:Uncharacterized protein n=1 Tax=Lasius platythorax TaxID=488582 RepID=A0AAV2N6U5_9HYME
MHRRDRLRWFSHSNLQPVKATCRAITQALISRKICIIHGTRRGCCVQYPAEVDRRALPELTARLGDRPLENSPLLEFVCSMWSAVSPGGWGASRRTRRVHLKYLNGLILSIEPRSTGTRDETTLTHPSGERGGEVWRMSDAALKRATKYRADEELQ